VNPQEVDPERKSFKELKANKYISHGSLKELNVIDDFESCKKIKVDGDYDCIKKLKVEDDAKSFKEFKVEDDAKSLKEFKVFCWHKFQRDGRKKRWWWWCTYSKKLLQHHATNRNRSDLNFEEDENGLEDGSFMAMEANHLKLCDKVLEVVMKLLMAKKKVTCNQLSNDGVKQCCKPSRSLGLVQYSHSGLPTIKTIKYSSDTININHGLDVFNDDNEMGFVNSKDGNNTRRRRTLKDVEIGLGSIIGVSTCSLQDQQSEDEKNGDIGRFLDVFCSKIDLPFILQNIVTNNEGFKFPRNKFCGNELYFKARRCCLGNKLLSYDDIEVLPVEIVNCFIISKFLKSMFGAKKSKDALSDEGVCEEVEIICKGRGKCIPNATYVNILPLSNLSTNGVGLTKKLNHLFLIQALYQEEKRKQKMFNATKRSKRDFKYEKLLDMNKNVAMEIGIRLDICWKPSKDGKNDESCSNKNVDQHCFSNNTWQNAIEQGKSNFMQCFIMFRSKLEGDMMEPHEHLSKSTSFFSNGVNMQDSIRDSCSCVNIQSKTMQNKILKPKDLDVSRNLHNVEIFEEAFMRELEDLSVNCGYTTIRSNAILSYGFMSPPLLHDDVEVLQPKMNKSHSTKKPYVSSPFTSVESHCQKDNDMLLYYPFKQSKIKFETYLKGFVQNETNGEHIKEETKINHTMPIDGEDKNHHKRYFARSSHCLIPNSIKVFGPNNWHFVPTSSCSIEIWKNKKYCWASDGDNMVKNFFDTFICSMNKTIQKLQEEKDKMVVCHNMGINHVSPKNGGNIDKSYKNNKHNGNRDDDEINRCKSQNLKRCNVGLEKRSHNLYKCNGFGDKSLWCSACINDAWNEVPGKLFNQQCHPSPLDDDTMSHIHICSTLRKQVKGLHVDIEPKRWFITKPYNDDIPPQVKKNLTFVRDIGSTSKKLKARKTIGRVLRKSKCVCPQKNLIPQLQKNWNEKTLTHYGTIKMQRELPLIKKNKDPLPSRESHCLKKSTNTDPLPNSIVWSSEEKCKFDCCIHTRNIEAKVHGYLKNTCNKKNSEFKAFHDYGKHMVDQYTRFDVLFKTMSHIQTSKLHSKPKSQIQLDYVKIHEKKARKKFVKDAIKDFWNSNATVQFEILNKIEGIEGRNARCKRIPRNMFMEEGIQVQLLVES
jgi:hypothetical protein